MRDKMPMITRALGPALTMVMLGACSGCFSTAQPHARLSSDEVRAATAFPWATYDALLHAHVDGEGRVDYAALRRNPRDLDRVLAFIADAGPRARPDFFPTVDHKKAFVIAAYNATAWRNVINRPPITNVNDVLANFFYFTEFVIDGEEINLKNYEDDRVRSVFNDPRMHFALNCASGGCPRLPAEAFLAERIEEQLDREARRFCNETRNVRVDTAGRKVVLSQIFEWYAEDFVAYEHAHGNPNGNQITYINRYREQSAQIPTSLEIEFVPYDWTINAQHAPGQAPSS